MIICILCNHIMLVGGILGICFCFGWNIFNGQFTIGVICFHLNMLWRSIGRLVYLLLHVQPDSNMSKVCRIRA